MKTYITTSIPYVNAQPHVGFALELVQADAISRCQRAAGAEVRFQTGTDENAFKNVEAARVAGVETGAWVDRRAAQFQQLSNALDVSYDRFLRTTEDAHTRAVHRFWCSLRPGDLYSKPYAGLYCQACEDFLFEQDLADGCCPDHGVAPIPVAETNYFFRLSAYQESIERWLGSDAVTIRPERRRQEILEFVRAGLRDFSVSRNADRSGGWGVKVPGDDSQVVYVWIDALTNYLSGLGYPEGDAWSEIWNPDVQKVHVIGKNVWKFHAIYWPALLLSAGLPLPDELVIHGFLTANGRKIGKSAGNGIAPDPFIERYGADALRYYLLHAIPAFGDGDFSADRFSAVYESQLVNGIGNLVSRIVALAVKSGVSAAPAELPLAADPDYDSACRERRHNDALAAVWKKIDAVNREVEHAKPWEALKREACTDIHPAVVAWLQDLHTVARKLAPFLPGTARKIQQTLSTVPLAAPAPLFPRFKTGM